jgi:hypothetical protein
LNPRLEFSDGSVDKVSVLEGEASSPDQKSLPNVPLLEKTETLSHFLEEMDQEIFLDLMRRIYASILSCLKGIAVQSDMIMDLIREKRCSDIL